MATTRAKIAEQCQVYLAGGAPADAQNVHLLDLMTTINQVINKLLKVQALENFSMGESIPNGLSIAEYPGIPVTKYNNVSASQLPVYPVKLAMNMGVFEIFPDGDPSADFIPLQQGDLSMLKSQLLLNALSGYIGFIPNGMKIVYTKDLTVGGTLTPTVTMRLVVVDFNQYSDTDILPVAADQEYDIVLEVCRWYSGEAAPDKIVDPGNSDNRVNQQLMA